MSNTLFINCTPHPVVVLADDGSPIVAFPPSGVIPRISELVAPTGGDMGVPIEYVEYGEPTGLPEASPGVHLIVSRVLAFALPHRDDLCFPSREVRDSTGRIIGCRALGYVDPRGTAR